MSWYDIPDPTDRWWDPKLHVELPIGRFVAQPVGNTSYCQGLHIAAHLAGEDERARGLLSFGARLEMDGTVTWHRQQVGYCEIKHERAEEIQEAALGVARTWFERDPSHCAIYYHDLAKKELWDLRRLLRDEQHTIDYLGKLLKDPKEPQAHNVKNAEGEWEHVLHTEAERAEYRNRWAHSIRRATSKLAQLHVEHDPRIAQLRSIEKRCHAFLEDQTLPLLPFEAQTQLDTGTLA